MRFAERCHSLSSSGPTVTLQHSSIFTKFSIVVLSYLYVL